jgi:hypothetical protein
MNWDGIFIATIAAIPGSTGAWFAYRAATSQRRREVKLETRKVDSEAFDRAQQIYQQAIDQLQEQVKDLQRSDTAKGRRIAQLEGAIRDLGGSVPPVAKSE